MSGTSTEHLELDGRRDRRDRNRDAVVDAMLHLIRGGNLRPGAAEIAERSGVSLRSVFRYFEDLDELAAVAIEAHQAEFGHLFDLRCDVTLPLADRVEALAAQRVRLYDGVAPIARSTALRAPFQPVLAEGLARRRSHLRRQVEDLFAPELAQLEADQRAAIAATLDAICSLESLELLRRARRLSSARTVEALERSITALLRPPTH